MNILKKNLRRPVFWIYVILLGGYACMVCIGFGKMIEEYEIGNPMAFTAMLSAVLLYMTPASYSTYAKRKGMLYRNCDVHFMFPSPVFSFSFPYSQTTRLTFITVPNMLIPRK